MLSLEFHTNYCKHRLCFSRTFTSCIATDGVCNANIFSPSQLSFILVSDVFFSFLLVSTLFHSFIPVCNVCSLAFERPAAGTSALQYATDLWKQPLFLIFSIRSSNYTIVYDQVICGDSLFPALFTAVGQYFDDYFAIACMFKIFWFEDHLLQNEDKEENTELPAVYQQTMHFVENDELFQVWKSQARRARTWLLQKLVCIPETISLNILTFCFILGNRRIKDIKQECRFSTSNTMKLLWYFITGIPTFTLYIASMPHVVPVMATHWSTFNHKNRVLVFYVISVALFLRQLSQKYHRFG